MVTARFRTRWMVLLISMFLLSACGGDDTSTPPTGTSEGTATSPSSSLLTINTDAPHSGTVGNKSVGKSYYTATGLTLGTTYTITLYGLSADADLEVYNGAPFDFPSGPVCTSGKGGTTIERCMVTADSPTMNIAVDGQYTLSGATYSISVNGPIVPATLCSGPGCTDFEGSIPTFTFSGTVTNWVVDTKAAVSVTHSIHSGPLNNSETSCFSYTPTSTTSYVSFNLRTDSEKYFGLLLFYIDDVLQPPVWYGSLSWQRVTFNTVLGTHTYKWCHTKNSANGAPDDAWVDDINIK